MKTEIKKIKGDWLEVLNNCRVTANKDLFDENHKEPTQQFKKAILLAEHSPIRCISISWMWNGIKSWIATHFCRHKWECFISTRRTDRYGVERGKLPQDTLVDFAGEANIQALIDTMRKRLCFQAATETRQYAEDLKAEIGKVDENIAEVLVPNCIYRCGCPEITSCGFFENFVLEVQEKEGKVDFFSLPERYAAYKKYRNSGRK